MVSTSPAQGTYSTARQMTRHDLYSKVKHQPLQHSSVIFSMPLGVPCRSGFRAGGNMAAVPEKPMCGKGYVLRFTVVHERPTEHHGSIFNSIGQTLAATSLTSVLLRAMLQSPNEFTSFLILQTKLPNLDLTSILTLFLDSSSIPTIKTISADLRHGRPTLGLGCSAHPTEWPTRLL